jgi:hypothetical protein
VKITEKMGTIRCQILQKNDEKLIVTLKNVTLVPQLWINSISFGKDLKNGYNIGNDGDKIKLTKRNVTPTSIKLLDEIWFRARNKIDNRIR